MQAYLLIASRDPFESRGVREVYDLTERGIGEDELIEGVRTIRRDGIPRLFGAVWQW